MTVDTALCSCERCAQAPANDLVETLVAAAADAIRNRVPVLTCGVGRVRGLHLELDLSNAGNVVDSVCWIARWDVRRKN